MTMPMLVDALANTSNITYETLGYLDAYDAVLNSDYTFVAYKDTYADTSAWSVRFKSMQTTRAAC